MTARVAELTMAIRMGVFSLYLMYKSAELPIGWIADEGPGGGAWPFWLFVMMLLSCIGIIAKWGAKEEQSRGVRGILYRARRADFSETGCYRFDSDSRSV